MVNLCSASKKVNRKETIESGSFHKITLSFISLRQSVIAFSVPPILRGIETGFTAGPTTSLDILP